MIGTTAFTTSKIDMTRQELIEFCERLGINCDKIKRMTDAEFERERDFQEEKRLKSKRP